MPNTSDIATRASQRILGNRRENATDDQQPSPVSSLSSTVNTSDDIEGALESQLHTENPTLGEEGQYHEADQQPGKIDQHPKENLYPGDANKPHGEDGGLEEDEDIGHEKQAQSSAFDRIFNRIQTSSVRETPPSIEGYEYKDKISDQLPAYSSQPPAGVIVVRDFQVDACPLTHESHDVPTPPQPYITSTLEQELLRANGSGMDDLSDSSSGAASDTGAGSRDSSSGDEPLPNEGRADETRAPPQKTSDKMFKEQEGLKKPGTYSPISSLSTLVNSSVGGQDIVEDKAKTGQKSTPSLNFSDNSDSILSRSILDIKGKDIPAIDKKGSTLPFSPTPRPQDPQRSPPPIFLPKNGVSDVNFAPFLKGSLPKPGESKTDVIVRDQIRRCEAIRERPLTDAEKEVIRSFYQDMERPRAFDEVSEPTFIHSPASLAEVEKAMAADALSGASDGGRGLDTEAAIEDLREESNRTLDMIDALLTRLEKVERRGASDKRQLLTTIDMRTGNLSRKIGEIEIRQEGIEKQLKSSQRQINAARADIAQFQVEMQAADEKLKGLEKKMQTVANEPGNKSKNGLDTKSKARTTTLAGRDDPDLQAAGSSQTPARWLQQAGGFNLSFVVLAMMVLVWLVTEAMLHSKRLADGYGPFINGGFNGLGSVVIFGTWTKFVLFYAVALYLGVFSVMTALGR
ncbi:uncharacterized protein B0H64DRAFT_324642 [Chaetomium fimeti]|uniref:Uncharacterized protein n=1 Tax=Chaetomium fimeti TaxID=1854472 RepID=A0AAE0HEJ0_9PEZI|nr:hypothetical protein B0H64DRAFT_324642 [Chaetomium fimeti]